MIKRLKLERFKNFLNAEVGLGPLTVLVGTNASGKSNLRDAFRFLHGISRGYSMAEIIGEKWIEGGTLQWKGIRGGIRETVYNGYNTFSLEASFSIASGQMTYKVRVELNTDKAPRVVRESLQTDYDLFKEIFEDSGEEGLVSRSVFDSHPTDDPVEQKDPHRFIHVRLPRDRKNRKHGKNLQFTANQPVLTQIVGHKDAPQGLQLLVQQAIDSLASMRFLDLSADAMRMPSIPGQIVLGDRGENLSSVLQAICENPQSKQAVVEWIRELTPLDVVDFEFTSDQTGRILVTLIESGGRKTSAYSASDGTLRFLAMIAALLGPQSAKFYFVEELENGIHPTRLYLLLQLIEQRVDRGSIQVVATTHSPQLLAFLNEKSRSHAALVYRLEGRSDAKVRRILDIPEAQQILATQDLSRLHGTGWLEDAVSFLEGASQS